MVEIASRMRIVENAPTGLILPRETYSPDIATIYSQRTDRLGDHRTRREIVHELMRDGLKRQVDMLAPVFDVLVSAASRAQQGYVPIIRPLEQAEKAVVASCPERVVKQAQALAEFRKFLGVVANSQALLRLVCRPVQLIEDFYIAHIEKISAQLSKLQLTDLQNNLGRFVVFFQRIREELDAGEVNVEHLSDFVSSCATVRSRLAVVLEKMPDLAGANEALQNFDAALQSLDSFCSDAGRNINALTLCDRRIITLDAIQDKIAYLKRGNAQSNQAAAGARMVGLRGALGAIHSELPEDLQSKIRLAELSNALIHPFGVGCCLDSGKFEQLWGRGSAALSLPNGIIVINSRVPLASLPEAFIQALMPRIFSTSTRSVGFVSSSEPYAKLIEASKEEASYFSTKISTPRARTFLALNEHEALLDLFNYASQGWSAAKEPLELSNLSRAIDGKVKYLSTVGPQHKDVVDRDVVQQHVTAMDLDLVHLRTTLNEGFELCATQQEWVRAIALLSVLPMGRWDRFPKLVQAVCKDGQPKPS